MAVIFLNEISDCQTGKEKLLIAYVMHEILLSSQVQGDQFIKAFGDRLKLFVDQIAYSLAL